MKETPNIQRPTPNIQCQTCEFGTRELTKKEWETKISEPFRFFRVFRGQKRFYYPRNTLKDAKPKGICLPDFRVFGAFSGLN